MSVAPFIHSSMRALKGMLEVAEVGPDDVVYDLGSGDGRIVLSAVLDFKARRAVGVELRRDLVERALKEILRTILADRVKIVHADMFNTDVGEATVVTLYLTSRGNERLKPKLERDLKPGARVVSLNYRVPRLETRKGRGTRVFPNISLSNIRSLGR